jgi:hypothetical protein
MEFRLWQVAAACETLELHGGLPRSGSLRLMWSRRGGNAMSTSGSSPTGPVVFDLDEERPPEHARERVPDDVVSFDLDEGGDVELAVAGRTPTVAAGASFAIDLDEDAATIQIGTFDEERDLAELEAIADDEAAVIAVAEAEAAAETEMQTAALLGAASFGGFDLDEDAGGDDEGDEDEGDDDGSSDEPPDDITTDDVRRAQRDEMRTRLMGDYMRSRGVIS